MESRLETLKQYRSHIEQNNETIKTLVRRDVSIYNGLLNTIYRCYSESPLLLYHLFVVSSYFDEDKVGT